MLAVARLLERGAWGGPLPATLGRAWEHTLGRTVIRELAWPSHVRVVAVGGATLGGSGKTPLAMACAAHVAARGASVALVGHAYRARPGRARVVREDDALGDVGDEALLAARALRRSGVRVVVAPSRSEAVAFAARLADVLVIDGVAQTAPVRASLALLAVDAAEPWGRAVALPPGGDLRAPIWRLVEACDMVVAVGDERQPSSLPAAHHARVAMHGVQVGDELLGWDEVARLRVGLLSALSRPDRVVRALELRGVQVRATVRARDHGPFSGAALGHLDAAPVDLWLATPKCALHACFGAHAGTRRAPIGVLSSSYVLPPTVEVELEARLGLALT